MENPSAWEWLMNPWIAVGFLGQAVFTARFLVQWLASERRRDSVMPVAFWWLSLAGGLILLTYAAVHLRDPVIGVGQAMGLVVYARNLMLVRKAKRRAARHKRRHAAKGPMGLKDGRPAHADSEAPASDGP
jgi:lipid-A-disaccharide synthase-like uncharacterized protein